jgi:hypothetical protein
MDHVFLILPSVGQKKIYWLGDNETNTGIFNIPVKSHELSAQWDDC